jgi:4-hydroxy-tetrahydrodipicolinate synthase
MAFEGVRPVLHLPFGSGPEQGILDDELALLARTMLAEGAAGLVVLGLASESWAVTEVERDRVVEISGSVCGGAAPLVVGIDGSTSVAIDRARALRVWAADLWSCHRDKRVGGRHWCGISQASPMVPGYRSLSGLAPQVTGSLDVATIVELARHPLVRSVKSEIPGAGAKASAITAEGLELVVGWGGLGYLEQIPRGAVGCMPGCDLGPAVVAIDRFARTGAAGQATDCTVGSCYLSMATTSLELCC